MSLQEIDPKILESLPKSNQISINRETIKNYIEKIEQNTIEEKTEILSNKLKELLEKISILAKHKISLCIEDDSAETSGNIIFQEHYCNTRYTTELFKKNKKLFLLAFLKEIYFKLASIDTEQGKTIIYSISGFDKRDPKTEIVPSEIWTQNSTTAIYNPKKLTLPPVALQYLESTQQIQSLESNLLSDIPQIKELKKVNSRYNSEYSSILGMVTNTNIERLILLLEISDVILTTIKQKP